MASWEGQWGEHGRLRVWSQRSGREKLEKAGFALPWGPGRAPRERVVRPLSRRRLKELGAEKEKRPSPFLCDASSSPDIVTRPTSGLSARAAGSG